MKKTLLLAAALACSGVAQADTWACTSTAGVSLAETGILSEGIIGRAWVADTERGARYPSPYQAGSEYLGKCEVTVESDGRKFVFCTSYPESGLSVVESLRISELTTGETIFTASHLSTAGVIYAGSCIKI